MPDNDFFYELHMIQRDRALRERSGTMRQLSSARIQAVVFGAVGVLDIIIGILTGDWGSIVIGALFAAAAAMYIVLAVRTYPNSIRFWEEAADEHTKHLESIDSRRSQENTESE